jgi:hypothetical protein
VQVKIGRNVLVCASLVLAVLVVASGCGGEDKDKEGAGKACAPAPKALAGTPALPTGFPTVDGVTYTRNTKDGPSEIVSGYRNGDVGDAYDTFKSAVSGASGYSVTKSEHEDFDAEVNFAGGSKTGQVKLLQSCKDRTEVTITARPQ